MYFYENACRNDLKFFKFEISERKLRKIGQLFSQPFTLNLMVKVAILVEKGEELLNG